MAKNKKKKKKKNESAPNQETSSGDSKRPSEPGEENGSLDRGLAVAVSLSGGGHRAALFGLGVLWALSDLKLAKHVSSISSVSGGSITSAYIGSSMNYRDADERAFAIEASNLATRLAHDWSIFRTWTVRLYLVAVLGAVVLGAGVAFSPDIPGWLKPILVLALGGVLVWARWIPAGAHFRRIFGKMHLCNYRLHGKEVSRLGLHFEEATNHVICATSLESGKHLYLSPRFVFSPLYGWADPRKTRWSDAVRASAALPGAFPPKWIKTTGLSFSLVRGSPPRRVPLFDGGVYDNLADQWPAGLAHRLEEYELESPALEIPDLLFAVNASAELGPSHRSQYRVPMFGEIRALLRAKNVMYNNAAALRTQGLIGKFDRSAIHLRKANNGKNEADEVNTARNVAIELRRLAGSDRDFVRLIAEDTASDVTSRADHVASDFRETLKEKLVELEQGHDLDALLRRVRETMAVVPGELVKKGGLPMRGVLVEIDDSPFAIVHKYGETIHGWHWPDRAKRAGVAREVLEDHLGEAPEAEEPRTYWARIVDENRAVGTHLSATKPEVAGRLMYHAYMLTIINAWVILGPLVADGEWIKDFPFLKLPEWIQRAT